MRYKRTPLQLEADALNSVIVASGFATEPDPNFNYHTLAYIKAWKQARKAGFFRLVTAAERQAHVENREAVREVILAMVERAVRIDTKRTYFKDPVEDALDRLKDVVYEIQDKKNSYGDVHYTLTEAGARRLEELSAPK